tara:strand:- start:396 stop:761 length:366 start_codon:yes stop_codon:yes gene_type:complete
MDGENIDIDHSEARGDFLKSLKKTYSRRSDRDAPKTTKDRLKRVGGLIPLVALAKAGGMGKDKSRGSTSRKRPVSRRRPVSQEKIEGRPKRKLGRRAIEKAKARQSVKPSVVNAHKYFKNS